MTETSPLNITDHQVAPRNFKGAVGRHAEQFLGYEQQDAQEFLAYMLDGIHEDLNRGTTVQTYSLKCRPTV